MTTVPRDNKPTLFLVEDEEGTGVLLKFLLVRGGYTVVYAADGQQAQTMIDQMPPPTLVLLDIMLPYLKGRLKITRSSLPSSCSSSSDCISSRSPIRGGRFERSFGQDCRVPSSTAGSDIWEY